MKILMFSINPLFPDKVNGGSPKHLQAVAVHLGELGHAVTILTTRRPDSERVFRWHPRVEVRPLLRFKQPFPEPYAIPYYEYAQNIQLIAEHLSRADRFYMHDGELLFPEVYAAVPTVVSLRDNIYAETMIGAFLFRGDALIAISEYSRQLYLATAGRFWAGAESRVQTINNGIDWSVFRPTPPSDELLQLLDFRPGDGPVVLHPHRPEPFKGIWQTIEVAERLVKEFGMASLRVLVPRWFDADFCDQIDGSYAEMLGVIESKGLSRNFHFHPWVPHRLMAEYFSLGDLMLTLGPGIETFGNTVYESLGCGTPVIVARVGPHRTLLPEGLVDRVDYADNAAAAEKAAAILQARRRTAPETLAYLHRTFDVATQLDAYAATILGAQKRPPLRYRRFEPRPDTRYCLAPWCYQRGDGVIYHDFRAEALALPELVELLGAEGRFEASRAAPQALRAWCDQGLVAPELLDE